MQHVSDVQAFERLCTVHATHSLSLGCSTIRVRCGMQRLIFAHELQNSLVPTARSHATTPMHHTLSITAFLERSNNYTMQRTVLSLGD